MKPTRITVRLPFDVSEWLQTSALLSGQTQTQLVEAALRLAMAANGMRDSGRQGLTDKPKIDTIE